MFKVFNRNLFAAVLLLLISATAFPQKGGKKCFGSAAKTSALSAVRVWMQPDASYDPVVGYGSEGPRRGAPPSDDSGRTLPLVCSANPKTDAGGGTTPKFYCSVAGVTDNDGDLIRYKIKPHFKGQTREKRNGEIYGEFLSSRFSKALGFFADDEWVADVSCPDCEKSLTSKFQGAPFSGNQPAAGIELGIGKGLDVDCNGKDSVALDSGIAQAAHSATRDQAAVDAFKLWLGFIDHGDTKTDNHKFACLKTSTGSDGGLRCDEAIFYVSDMGSTFGFSTASEGKARLEKWRGKDPIKMDGGRCKTTAKSVGDTNISEAGRALLADGLTRLIDAERSRGTITKVFEASRNAERDQPASAWTAEFIRKANTIIKARCGK